MEEEEVEEEEEEEGAKKREINERRGSGKGDLQPGLSSSLAAFFFKVSRAHSHTLSYGKN